MIYRLLKVELYKIFSRPRSYIGFVAIAILVFIFQLALFVDGKTYLTFLIQQLETNFSISGNILNGYLITYVILQTLIVQMPLMVALVTGDLLSGEASAGTMRLLATKPISRANIITAKFIAGSFYTLLLVLWLGGLALGFGLWIFKTGDLMVLSTDHISIIPAAECLWRFFAACVVAFISLSVVTTFSLMLSAFSDNSIVPIVSTMAVIIIFTIIGTLDMPLFNNIKPLLFTTHMIVWQKLFQDPLSISTILKSIAIMLAYIVGFLSVTYYRFIKKDILS